MPGSGKELLKWYRGREEWKLGRAHTAFLSVLVAGLVCTGVAAIVWGLWDVDGDLVYASTLGLLLLDILLASAAASGYILVSSRAPRPSQLHSHGLALLLMLISYSFHLAAETFFYNLHCSYWAAAVAASHLFFGAYKAVFFLLVRRRMKALGPPASCCVQADRWGLALVISIVAVSTGGLLINTWASFLMLRGIPCEEFDRLLSLELAEAEVPAADKAAFLGSLSLGTLGMLGSFITGSGMVCSSWQLTRRAVSKLTERQVSAEELSRVEVKLRRHLLGVVIAIFSTQLSILGFFVGDLGLVGGAADSVLAGAAAFTVDLAGDIAGILLLSGLGTLLIREDPTAGDVSGHIRGLLHSAVLTSQAQMVFEGRVDQRSKFCVASFPGKYLADWHALTWACEQGDLSSACVFLPKEDPQHRFGQHVESPETPGKCWCCSLYGKEQPWGCMWFEAWKENVERAVEMGLPLVAVFFPGQAGKGVVRWEDLGAVELWDGVGLGGSQKAEVAYLRSRGLRVVEEDLKALQRRIGHRRLRGGGALARLGSSVSNGVRGVRSLSRAVSSVTTGTQSLGVGGGESGT